MSVCHVCHIYLYIYIYIYIYKYSKHVIDNTLIMVKQLTSLGVVDGIILNYKTDTRKAASGNIVTTISSSS